MNGIVDLLGRQGSPSVLLWAIGMIRRLYRGDPEGYERFLRRQAQKPDWLPRFLAAHELHRVIKRNPEAGLPLLRELSDVEHEMVREGAAHSWSELLAFDFGRYFPVIRGMKGSDRYPQRHTAALAPVRCFRSDRLDESAKQRVLEFWESYEDDPRQGLWNLVRQQILARTRSETTRETGNEPWENGSPMTRLGTEHRDDSS